MKTFQRQIKAAYLSTSIKLIKSKSERGQKQNLTHCSQISSTKECMIMRKCCVFIGPLNVAPYRKAHKWWCLCSHNVSPTGQRIITVKLLSTMQACTKQHWWCLNLVNTRGPRQLVAIQVLRSFHITNLMTRMLVNFPGDRSEGVHKKLKKRLANVCHTFL